jgi:hypothetical protein
MLIEQLGLEPGAALQRLERAILAGDPDVELPTAATARVAATAQSTGRGAGRDTPAQLPADIADFTGRAERSP